MNTRCTVFNAGLAVTLAIAAVALGACQTGAKPRTAAVVPAAAPDQRVLARLLAELPVGSPREAARARAEELGMVRKPMLTTRSMEGGMPVYTEVEGLDLDIFAIGNGAAAALVDGSSVQYIAMLFSEDGRLCEILLDYPPPAWDPSPEGVTYGFADGAAGGVGGTR